MNRISVYLITLIPFLISILGWMIQPRPVQAQVGEEDSQELMEEGNEQIPADIRELEEEREKKEEQLEETLNIEEPNPNEPKVEEVPDPDEELGLDDNLPYQPTDEETEIKF
jgi:rRNA maturation endonuclease Nob1